MMQTSQNYERVCVAITLKLIVFPALHIALNSLNNLSHAKSGWLSMALWNLNMLEWNTRIYAEHIWNCLN